MKYCIQIRNQRPRRYHHSTREHAIARYLKSSHRVGSGKPDRYWKNRWYLSDEQLQRWNLAKDRLNVRCIKL